MLSTLCYLLLLLTTVRNVGLFHFKTCRIHYDILDASIHMLNPTLNLQIFSKEIKIKDIKVFRYKFVRQL